MFKLAHLNLFEHVHPLWVKTFGSCDPLSYHYHFLSNQLVERLQHVMLLVKWMCCGEPTLFCFFRKGFFFLKKKDEISTSQRKSWRGKTERTYK